MAWFTANWFWILTFIAFILMHIFCHGGHGGHSGHGGSDHQRNRKEKAKDEASMGDANKSSDGHRN